MTATENGVVYDHEYCVCTFFRYVCLCLVVVFFFVLCDVYCIIIIKKRRCPALEYDTAVKNWTQTRMGEGSFPVQVPQVCNYFEKIVLRSFKFMFVMLKKGNAVQPSF